MNMKKNMKEHSTIYYDIPGLILRRGQEFSFIIKFNQIFYLNKYQISIIFKHQTWKNFPNIKIPLNNSSNGWSTKIIQTKNNQIILQIISSSDAIIGKYSVSIQNKQKNFLMIEFFF